MEEIKLFVKDIGLKHRWGNIEIFLLDREETQHEILSINGFANLVS